MASDNIRPAILGPFDLLDGGFTPQRAPAARISEGFIVVMPRTTAQRGVIPFAGRGIDQRAMPLLLQIGTRRVEIRDERIRRHAFEGQRVQRLGSGHDFLMRIHGTAFSGEQVVIAIDLVQMWPLGEFDVRTAPNRTFSFRLELHRLHIEFGQCDAVEAMMVLTKIPSLLHQILAAIVVMEQAGVEADTVHANRLAPRTMDTFGSDQIVRAILERTVHDLHVRVDQPEFAVRIGKIRSPDATG